jgi:hypothetical protein
MKDLLEELGVSLARRFMPVKWTGFTSASIPLLWQVEWI